MLVLSRHRDEAIIIGHDIKITIVDIRGDKVRLGIEAPEDLTVHREEIYRQVFPDGAKSSTVQPPPAAE